MTSPVGQRHLRPPPAGDLVAHARVAVLGVEAVQPLRPPAVVELAGEAAGGGHGVVGRLGQAVDGADHLGVRRALLLRRHVGTGDLVDVAVVLRRLGGRPLGPARRTPRQPPRPRRQLGEALASVGDEREGEVLDGVVPGRVEPDEAHVLVAEQRPRAGREVLQPRPDGEHDVGLGGQRVGRRAPGDADRAGVQRVRGEQAGLAGDGLDDGDVVPLGERGQRRLGERVVHAAAGDDQRALGARRAHCAARAQLTGVGSRPGDLVDGRLEQPLRVVVRLGPARPGGGRGTPARTSPGRASSPRRGAASGRPARAARCGPRSGSPA